MAGKKNKKFRPRPERVRTPRPRRVPRYFRPTNAMIDYTINTALRAATNLFSFAFGVVLTWIVMEILFGRR